MHLPANLLSQQTSGDRLLISPIKYQILPWHRFRAALEKLVQPYPEKKKEKKKQNKKASARSYHKNIKYIYKIEAVQGHHPIACSNG